jgi:hypothetical protein
VEHSIGSRTDLNEVFLRSERRSGTCIVSWWGPPDCAFYLTPGATN